MKEPRDSLPGEDRIDRPRRTERDEIDASDAQTQRIPVPGEVREVERQTMPLREEELVAEKHVREAGVVRVRKEIEEVPGRLEVEALREQVSVEHVPVGREVSERKQPWQDGDDIVVPIYEEQMVLEKHLILKEELHVRRVSTKETRVFEDTLRKERPVIESPDPKFVREQYPTRERNDTANEDVRDDTDEDDSMLGKLGRRLIK